MIDFIRQLKIKHKLVLIIMLTVVLILLLVGSTLIISERYLSRQSMADQLMTISHIIADRSTAALSFDDQAVAAEVLSALEHKSSVVLACIYDHSQSLFTSYARDNSANCPPAPQNEGYQFQGEYFNLYQSVYLEGERIGTVHIRASLAQLNERLLQFIFLVLFMVSMAGIVAYLLAIKLQSIISKPILELATVAKQISIDADYTPRLPLGSNDEIGTLNIAFNNMLEQIYKRQLARDEATQALSERERDLVVTLNSIGDAVIVTDINGLVTRMNPVAEQLTGWSFEDARNKPLKTIFPILNASTREPIENPVEKVALAGETVFLSNHTTLIAKDGTERQIADSAAPIRSEDDNILGVILVFNDVTEQYHLREAAAKSKRDLQAIMDNSPTVIHVKDIHGHFTFINQQFDKLLNIERKDITGKTLHDIFPQDVADALQHNDNIVISTGQSLEAEECISLEDGLHTYASIKFPLFNEENNVYAVCSISTDITERRQQEEQLRRSQKMDALGKLTGGIAHDYNNLLGIIKGYAELLNEQLAHDPALEKYAGIIEHAAERGTKLTRKLLAFTRHKSSDASDLDINELLIEQRLMLEKTLTARITLNLDLADKLWPAWLDSGDMEDAIINMSINASHAINGNGQLTFRTRNEQLDETDAQALHLTAGDYIQLNITDTGMGMDQVTKDKIFDPFFSTKGEQGTGLGLSQVYGFVKRSGGEIKVYSEPGHGSHFVFYFPRNNKTSMTTPVKTAHTEKQNLRGTETLLVVDDEIALVELARDILSTQGYRVLTAIDGEQALSILKKEKVDLIFSDVIMPRMDGYQLAARVQEHYPDIKIQLASGFSDSIHSHMTDTDLHLNLLHKPYKSEALLVHIRNLLDTDTDRKKVDAHANKEKDTQQTLAGKNILIMDDETDVQVLLSLNLEKLGCNIICANNGDEAIRHYQQSLTSASAIDIVILDIHIPGSLSGIEVAAEIRSLNKKVRIIVTSGDSSAPEMTSFQHYGFDTALEKNFNRNKIKQVLEEVLRP